MGTVSLIVMERGSEWPGHVGGFDDLVVVGQDETGLLHRTEKKLDALRRRRQYVRVAVLACGDSPDVASGVRAEVARQLAAAVAEAGFGRLVLTANATASLPLRQELLTLVGTLTEQTLGKSATISLTFRGPAPARAPWRSLRKAEPGDWPTWPAIARMEPA